VPSPTSHPLFERINAALPQTQCARCTYPDCASYALAIASGDAAINQCPPGGAEGVRRLAAITGRTVEPLNPVNGQEGPRAVAVIDESWCIGCTLCIEACPTDAVLGSNKLMHTVIEAFCTGCELCLPVCPVDCIVMENVSGAATAWDAWSPGQATEALDRYEVHSKRFISDGGWSQKRLEEKAPAEFADQTRQSDANDTAPGDKKRAVIEAALARARARQAKVL
jgi:electron transport complex protein RnfB